MPLSPYGPGGIQVESQPLGVTPMINPAALAAQLYQIIIEDGCDPLTAEKVMQMLTRLPPASMQTCIVDVTIRARMVQRCLQKLRDGLGPGP